jgi:hypothetical protein
MWCFAKKACMRAVEWAGTLMQIRWSACWVIVNATVTHYTSSVNGVSLPTDCSRMHSKVTSDWQPSYIRATWPVLEIFKMAGFFPDRPRMDSPWRRGC